jgi:cell division protein FtsZ
MIHFDLPKEKSSIIKVIGIGGGGSNAVNYMHSQRIDGVNFIICNTDAQAIALSEVPNKVQLGPHLTQGLGAGANPEIGRQATEESLEEIKRMLEVNTKMAFITAGMGGGTGTGGAPIISKICKDLGILTVGIVTTPFAYEGKKRQQQAEDGIKILKQYVDTLLVISNDKLRHQFGNLKMKEAFAKADNVLATAAKCITDVINSTGQINVDFADVCTVMKSGGVAILGSAAAEGENRAQRAIEEALNSPLLNDNDIRGARWILININSAEGEHEFTMDEVEVIQNYLLNQAGEDTDVILGMGYDHSLDNKIGITLIATGFQHKDPFAKAQPKKEEPKKEEKIVMVLGEPHAEEKKIHIQLPSELKKKENPLAPKLVEENSTAGIDYSDDVARLVEQPFIAPETESGIIHWELNMETAEENKITIPGTRKNTVEKKPVEEIREQLNSPSSVTKVVGKSPKEITGNQSIAASSSAVSGGYLARPSNIYAESKDEVSTPSASAEEPVQAPAAKQGQEDDLEMQLVVRDDIPAADLPLAEPTQMGFSEPVEDPALRDETEEQKRRTTERLQKLRNLSFNLNSVDPNNEFENVPAYIRRNMELYNTSSQIENFYSNYQVRTDEKNNTQISTINTFLDGEKPD